ncbi:MAG: MarR family transcriptional regulator [Alphaproteobacteria bacterium]|nr:MarR family transcriptional regulator [Alphaproteobacteria bacterium]
MKKHDLKDDIGYWLNRLRMQVHHGFEVRLEAYDVSIAQWCILLALYNESAASITELSKFIEVDKASISRVVERLLTKELVTHQAGNDRRSGHVQLTQKGRELIPFLIQAAQENEQQFFGGLTSQEREQFRHLFHKLFLNLSSIQMSGWLINVKENDDV